MTVICIKVDGREDQLTLKKEYEAEIKYGFYMNIVEIIDDRGHKMPVPTEYFKEKKWERK